MREGQPNPEQYKAVNSPELESKFEKLFRVTSREAAQMVVTVLAATGARMLANALVKEYGVDIPPEVAQHLGTLAVGTVASVRSLGLSKRVMKDYFPKELDDLEGRHE